MSDIDRPLSSEEREEEERRRREGRLPLDQEIARKYDVDRLRRVVGRGAGRGEQLDLATRGDMERVLPGHDFSNVRIFRGALAEEITRKNNADALTLANTGMILMRDSSRGAAGTTSARALLAHELTHVAQAQRGMHFAKENGGGEGEHEEEAEMVEAEVGGDASGSSQEDTDKAGDTPAQVRKRDARHQVIIKRVLELMLDDEYHNLERRGSFGGT